MTTQDESAQDPGVDDATIAATGKFSEAVERIERARGSLYDFHQLVGRADDLVGEAARMLADAGHCAWADRISAELHGCDVIDSRWTFQIVDDFDDGYWSRARKLRTQLEHDVVGGRRHLYESTLKQNRGKPAPGHSTDG